MTIEQQIFECSSVDFSKLEKYGFKKSKNTYIFEKMIMNNAFKAVVTVSLNGSVKGNVYDVDTNDIYFQIRVDEMAVGYAGLVRAEYIALLEDIRSNCTIQNLFISEQTNRLASLIKEKYGDSPVFPWEKYPACGVFKNPNNNKWYALIMSLDFEKLDPQKSGKVEIMNLKIDDQKIPNLTKQIGIYPAYHMNKKYWVTLVLNNCLSDNTVLSLIEESHAFTLQKKKTISSKQ